jgi:hypothetical protein
MGFSGASVMFAVLTLNLYFFEKILQLVNVLYIKCQVLTTFIALKLLLQSAVFG